MSKLQFFTITALSPDSGTAELNSFLAAHRIVAIEKQFVDDGSGSFWSICITYTESPAGLSGKIRSKRQKVDYREVLSEKDFARYVRLRDLRNRLAQEEGIAPYLVFTNEQLARMIQDRVQTRTAMLEISGVGPTKLEKYADEFLSVLRQLCTAEKNGETDQDIAGRDS